MNNQEIETTEAEIISYLTFKLDEEQFAINVGKVIEILEVPLITKVPRSPEFMKGVVNLRGNVLPVIDTRIKFGMEDIDFTVDTCILVLNIEVDDESIFVGALVDSVQEVLELSQEQIQPSPSIGAKYKSEFISGMIKTSEQFTMLINIDKVFSIDEVSLLSDVSEDVMEETTEETTEDK